MGISSCGVAGLVTSEGHSRFLGQVDERSAADVDRRPEDGAAGEGPGRASGESSLTGSAVSLPTLRPSPAMENLFQRLWNLDFQALVQRVGRCRLRACIGAGYRWP